MVKITTSSSEQTRCVGRKLGKRLGAGDIVCLKGQLGAGKTAFAKGIAEGLGVKSPVNSPSFVIVNRKKGRLPMYHIDLYRINSETEIEGLGLEDYLFSDGVAVVEWADKISGYLKNADCVWVDFRIRKNETRELTIRGKEILVRELSRK